MPSIVMRRMGRIGLAAAAVVSAAPAFSADLAYPYPPEEPAPSQVYREERIEEAVPPLPPRAEAPLYGPRFAGGPRLAPPPPEGECRTVVKRRIDEDGEEVVRRVRVCEDGLALPPRPDYRPSFYRPGPPVPPADVPDEGDEGPPRF